MSQAADTTKARTSWWKGRSELGVALGLAVVGIIVAIDALTLPEGLTARGPVGPETVPLFVAGLLLVVSALLARDVLRGGRGEPEGGEDVDLSHASDWRTIGLLAAAFAANAVLIERVGWPVSGAILFWGAAFALGSRHYIRNAVIALTLSIGTWYLFVLGLGVHLPVGILDGIL
jgi:putative tricarboxylic transport membrane protein